MRGSPPRILGPGRRAAYGAPTTRARRGETSYEAHEGNMERVDTRTSRVIHSLDRKDPPNVIGQLVDVTIESPT